MGWQKRGATRAAMHLANLTPYTLAMYPAWFPEIWTAIVNSGKKSMPVTSHESLAARTETSVVPLMSDWSLKAWRGACKPTHIYPSQAAFTSSPVSLKHFSWLLSEICLPQETSRLSSRIKSKFSLQLLPASLCSVQITDLKILDQSKEAKSKKRQGGKRSGNHPVTNGTGGNPIIWII